MNPTRNSGSGANPGITTPMMMMAPTTTVTGCPCAVNVVGGGAVTGNGNTIGSGTGSMGGNSGAYSDDATTSNAETLLSSNAKFQAISAIAVTQDGVINVADQGEFSIFFSLLKYESRFMNVMSHDLAIDSLHSILY